MPGLLGSRRRAADRRSPGTRPRSPPRSARWPTPSRSSGVAEAAGGAARCSRTTTRPGRPAGHRRPAAACRPRTAGRRCRTAPAGRSTWSSAPAELRPALRPGAAATWSLVADLAAAAALVAQHTRELRAVTAGRRPARRRTGRPAGRRKRAQLHRGPGRGRRGRGQRGPTPRRRVAELRDAARRGARRGGRRARTPVDAAPPPRQAADGPAQRGRPPARRAGRGGPVGAGRGRAARRRPGARRGRPATRTWPALAELEERLRLRRGRRRSTRSPPPRSATGCAPRCRRPGRTRWRSGSPCAPPRSGSRALAGRADVAAPAGRGRSGPPASGPPPAGPPAPAAPAIAAAVAGRRRRARSTALAASLAARPPSDRDALAAGPRRAGGRAAARYAAPAKRLGAELDRLTDEVHRDEVARAEQRLRIEQLEAQAAEEFGARRATRWSPSTARTRRCRRPRPRSPRPRPTGEPEPEPVPLRPGRRRRSGPPRPSATWPLLGKVNPLALEEFAALEERLQVPLRPARGPQGHPPRPAHRGQGRRRPDPRGLRRAPSTTPRASSSRSSRCCSPAARAGWCSPTPTTC